ncbi:MAG: L,D-transpeptidase family protein [Phycisphaerales bacterium]|nr:L,D-transpeptidase family protein [Phycisphaerales bacterium]
MALQSQTSRSTGWSASPSNNLLRGAPAGTKMLVALAGVGALAIGVIAWSRMSGPSTVRETTSIGNEASLGSLVYAPPSEAATPAGPTSTKAAMPATLTPAPVREPLVDANSLSARPTVGASGAMPTNTPAPTPRDPLSTPSAPVAPIVPAATTPGTPPTPAAPAVTEPSAATPAAPGANATQGAQAVARAQQAVASGNLLEARTVLNAALWDASLAKNDRAAIRAQLAALNDKLFFSAMVVKGDTLTDVYAVQPGDVMARLPIKNSWPVDYRFIQRINAMPNANSLRVGQRLKVVRMPIHVVVHKKDYRMDLYAGPPVAPTPGKTGPDGQEEGWVYLRSITVGLGESNGTPEGLFIVRPKSKLINPRWVNPRTGEVFEADNPKNPIGEHWIGLDGADENTRRFTGYGIHGTIDTDSVGRQMSMGCVRMNAEDVRLVWELLVDGVSAVKIIE